LAIAFGSSIAYLSWRNINCHLRTLVQNQNKIFRHPLNESH